MTGRHASWAEPPEAVIDAVGALATASGIGAERAGMLSR